MSLFMSLLSVVVANAHFQKSTALKLFQSFVEIDSHLVEVLIGLVT